MIYFVKHFYEPDLLKDFCRKSIAQNHIKSISYFSSVWLSSSQTSADIIFELREYEPFLHRFSAEIAGSRFIQSTRV